MYVPMTAMPQRIAFSHMFGALAATLVGVAEYCHACHGGPGEVGRGLTTRHGGASASRCCSASLTVTGSFMAFGKLQEFITGRPITYKGQNVVNITLFLWRSRCFVYLIYRTRPTRGCSTR